MRGRDGQESWATEEEMKLGLGESFFMPAKLDEHDSKLSSRLDYD